MPNELLEKFVSEVLPKLVPWGGLSPAAACALLALRWFFEPATGERAARPERPILLITKTALLASFGVSLLAAGVVFGGVREALSLSYGDWFALPGYSFPLTLYIDRLAAAMMVLTAAICGLIARFSATYLHREPGFFRFFLLLLLFTAAMQLLVMAGSIDLLFAGWELVGLSSVLLIAFFQERPGPVSGSLRAFLTYRSCDIGLLIGAVLLHHYAHTSQFDQIFQRSAGPASSATSVPALGSHPVLAAGPATLVALLFLLAAMGKSAQAPLTGWLPRAMEGPTPSSALFYGALSVHAGAYLLLRVAPLLAASKVAAVATVLVGAATALHATLVARVQVDVKSALAYGTAAQVGLIFIEIGLGLRTLAALHVCAHACVRAFQLLRAPAALHELRRVQAARGGELPRIGALYERLLPARLREALYRLALLRFYTDALLDRLVARPVLSLAHRLAARERAFRSRLAPRTPHPPSLGTDPRPGWSPSGALITSAPSPAGAEEEALP